ncbi:MAG: hypothetical protein AAGB93_09075 [Planctomycetota bacterium]
MHPLRPRRPPTPVSLGVLLASLLALATASCGGGGGDDAPNQQPAAAVWDEFTWDTANWS